MKRLTHKARLLISVFAALSFFFRRILLSAFALFVGFCGLCVGLSSVCARFCSMLVSGYGQGRSLFASPFWLLRLFLSPCLSATLACVTLYKKYSWTVVCTRTLCVR